MSDAVTEAPSEEPTVEPEDTRTGDDPAAEVERLRNELVKARKWEDRAKANANAAKELEKLREATMSDLEKAVAQAKTEGRTQALIEVGSERVADAVRVAAAGRNVDIDALLEGLDRSRFLNEDGTPDREAIEAWVDRIVPPPAESDGLRTFDLGQGARGDNLPLNGDPLLRDLKSKLGIR